MNTPVIAVIIVVALIVGSTARQTELLPYKGGALILPLNGFDDLLHRTWAVSAGHSGRRE